MESWSVNERIRSAPGKGGCGSAIVLVLAVEVCEGLLFIQCQNEASFIDNAVVFEEAKTNRSRVSLGKSTVMRVRRMRWLVMMVPIQSIRPSSHVKRVEVGEARDGQTSAPVLKLGE